MADLIELRALFNDSDLMTQVEAAIVISAHNLRSGTPSAADKAWAAHVFTNPNTEAKKALMGVLAENAAFTVAQIKAASPATIQANVDGLASLLVDAMAGV